MAWGIKSRGSDEIGEVVLGPYPKDIFLDHIVPLYTCAGTDEAITEKDHFGCPERNTGIYARPAPKDDNSPSELDIDPMTHLSYATHPVPAAPQAPQHARQIVLNWLMNDSTPVEQGGYWAGAEEIERVDALLAKLFTGPAAPQAVGETVNIAALKAKLREVSKGEYNTWGFVAMFMDMIDEVAAASPAAGNQETRKCRGDGKPCPVMKTFRGAETTRCEQNGLCQRLDMKDLPKVTIKEEPASALRAKLQELLESMCSTAGAIDHADAKGTADLNRELDEATAAIHALFQSQGSADEAKLGRLVLSRMQPGKDGRIATVTIWDWEVSRISESKIMEGADYRAPVQPCRGCGKPLLMENAWMEDGCPCNSPAGVNNMNLYRWWLIRNLQHATSIELEAIRNKRALTATEQKP